MVIANVDPIIFFLERHGPLYWGIDDDDIEKDKMPLLPMAPLFYDMWRAAGMPPAQYNPFALTWTNLNIIKYPNYDDKEGGLYKKSGLEARALKIWPSLLREAWVGMRLEKALKGRARVLYSDSLDRKCKIDYVVVFPDNRAIGVGIHLDTPNAEEKAKTKLRDRTYGIEIDIKIKHVKTAKDDSKTTIMLGTKLESWRQNKGKYSEFWAPDFDKINDLAEEIAGMHARKELQSISEINPQLADMIHQAVPFSEFLKIP